MNDFTRLLHELLEFVAHLLKKAFALIAWGSTPFMSMRPGFISGSASITATVGQVVFASRTASS